MVSIYRHMHSYTAWIMQLVREYAEVTKITSLEKKFLTLIGGEGFHD